MEVLHIAAGEYAERHLHPQPPISASADANDAAIREWLHDVMRRTGLKPTPLAKGADLAPSTLLRALDPGSSGSLERRSIEKIVQKYGVPPPAIYSDPATARAGGFGEPELVSILRPHTDERPLLNTEGDWEIRTRALELAGYLPGDKVRADSAMKPRPRDVVVAQVLDHVRGGAETVLRVYDPPFIITDTADPASKRKPLFVDGTTVSIWGVVVRSVRERPP